MFIHHHRVSDFKRSKKYGGKKGSADSQLGIHPSNGPSFKHLVNHHCLAALPGIFGYHKVLRRFDQWKGSGIW
jgi:hypothetical protein